MVETVEPEQEITSTVPITEALTAITPTESPSATAIAEVTAGATVPADDEPTAAQEVAASEATTTDTPTGMPVTGAGNGSRSLAILLTVAAVLALLIGLSLWEKRHAVR
jgi:hypothetical protein